MSSTWNGRVMPERPDTPAARCLGLIERGIERMGLGSAPARMNQLLASPEGRGLVVGPVAPEGAALVARILAAWRALGGGPRSVEMVARQLRISQKVAYRVLSEAGATRPTCNYRMPMPRKQIEAMLAAWRELPEAERKLQTHARLHGMSASWCWKLLVKAGLVEPKRRATA